jgi:hypothetical protein
MGWMAAEYKPKDHCWFYLSYRQAIPSSSSHALLSLCCLMVTVMTRTHDRSDRYDTHVTYPLDSVHCLLHYPKSSDKQNTFSLNVNNVVVRNQSFENMNMAVVTHI